MQQVKVLTQTQIDFLADLVSNSNILSTHTEIFQKELNELKEVLQQALVIKIEYSDNPFFSN